MAASYDDSFTFTVGKLDAGMAILIGERASLIEFPSLLLPPGVSSGSVVNIRVNRNQPEEKRQRDEFSKLQQEILDTFGKESPKPPALRLRNVTQTSVTLEWDRLSLATASLLSLDIYRNGERLAPIPNPLHNTSTKLSGLSVDSDYTFHLVLKTTSGTYSSPIIKTRTHTMTDTSGISVCFGNIEDLEIENASKEILEKLKAKSSEKIQIDTTHYVCSDSRNRGDIQSSRDSNGVMYNKAMQLSIPVVQPHWIFACHEQKKMVPISAYYLDQDPPNASRIRESISKASQSINTSTNPSDQPSNPSSKNEQEEPQTPSGVPVIDASDINGGGPSVMEASQSQSEDQDSESIQNLQNSKDGHQEEEEKEKDNRLEEEEEEEDLPPRPISRDEPKDQFGNGKISNGEHDEEIRGGGGEGEGEDDKDIDQRNDLDENGIKTEGSLDDVSLGDENRNGDGDEEAVEEIDLS